MVQARNSRDAMAKTKSTCTKSISSYQRKRSNARMKRNWHSILVRKHVYEMIVADRKSSGETAGAVIARWALERKYRDEPVEGMTAVFIAPEQTDRSQ